MPGATGGTVAEVDSVLTTGELAQLLDDHGRSLLQLQDSPLQQLLPSAAGAVTDDGAGSLLGYPGGSGGYLEHVFRFVASYPAGISRCKHPTSVVTTANIRKPTLSVNVVCS